MPASANDMDIPKPREPIRRFDVFAEYSRQEREEKGYPKVEAKGYGVWLAKVVAARRFGAGSTSPDRSKSSKRTGDVHEEPEPKFRSVGDEVQTDETFDEDIIERMGADFYDQVFVPAITDARTNGKSYESIRDTIRKEWKPARSRT